MTRAVVLGVVVVAAIAAAFVLGRVTSGETCGDTEVRVDGECEAIRPGKPSVPRSRERAEYIASVAVDQDPPADSLFTHCAFQGVAAGRVDVHLCVVYFHDSPRTMRLENDRGKKRYRVTVLSDPQPEAPRTGSSAGRTIECVYPDYLCPAEQSGG